MTPATTHAGAAEPFARSAGISPEARWNGVTLFAFRFSCAYFALEWVPLILLLQTSSLTSGLLSGPDWWGTLNRTVGQWAITHVLGLPEHSPPRFSANNLALFFGMVSFGLISATLAAAWSFVDRRRASHPQLFVWIHTFMRFVVGAIMLLYGWHKVLPGQFELTFDYLTLPVGQHSPRDLLWAFMGASRPYQVFTGLVEVTGGLLLLTQRTAMFGALVCMAAMANVLALDIAYDANVKFLAAQLFLMTLFVLAPFARRLVDMFVLDRDEHAASVRRVFRYTATTRAARVVGILFVGWIVYSNFHAAQRQVNANALARQTPLYGIWEVEEMSRNGVSVPLLVTDLTLWRRLVVQSTDAAVIVPMSDSPHPMPAAGRYRVQLDSRAQTVGFTPFAFSGTTQPLNFAYVLPDRDHLVLTGQSGDGGAVVVHLRRIDPSTYTLVNWERSWRW
jgi:hypothetical protein